MSDIKAGKKPIATKPKQVNPFTPDLFGNTLAIPLDVQAELDEAGLVGRWLNSKKVYANQGYHNMGWRVYKRTKPSTDAFTFKLGNDPDGIVRRGDCILGVKTIDEHRAHKDYLDKRASRGKTVNADKANELRKSLADAGMSGKVIEGYDDNE